MSNTDTRSSLWLSVYGAAIVLMASRGVLDGDPAVDEETWDGYHGDASTLADLAEEADYRSRT